MNPYMSRPKLLKLIDDCLETSFDFRVTRSENVTDCRRSGFKLEVLMGGDTWAPIIPVEEKIVPSSAALQLSGGALGPKHYAITWSYRKGKPRAVTFCGQGITSTYEEEYYGELTDAALLRYEMDFCKDQDFKFADIASNLNWSGWNGEPFFSCKTRSSAPPKPYVPNLCPTCNRERRDHERQCPNCTHGVSLYDSIIRGNGL